MLKAPENATYLRKLLIIAGETDEESSKMFTVGQNLLHLICGPITIINIKSNH